MVIHTESGWHHHFPFDDFANLTCTRPLFDHVVRARVLADAAASTTQVEVIEGTEAIGLLGNGQRVTGVRLRRRGKTSDVTTRAADLVIDASGRGSQTPRMLEELGLPAPTEEVVDAQLAYATRQFRFPNPPPGGGVVVQTESALPVAGVLQPTENDTWLLTLAGFAGTYPPSEEDNFLAYATRMRHPYLYDVMRTAEPVSPVFSFRNTANRLRHYERRGTSPDGLLVVGDAACAFNPVYGHGMAVAARHALALRDTLTRRGAAPGLSFVVQRAVARAATIPWRAATSVDRLYLAPSMTSRIFGRFSERINAHAAADERVAYAAHGVFTLGLPVTRLLSPAVAFRIARRPPSGLPNPPR